MKIIATIVMASVASAVVGGCALSEPLAGSADGSANDPSQPISSGPLKRVTLPVDDGVTDGIAIIQWQVIDAPAVISDFFQAHPFTETSRQSQEALARNGIRVAQIAYADLPTALDELGGTYANVRVWLGQATNWNQLGSLQIRGSLAVVVDGSTRRLAAGTLQLLLRGWTVPLETGAATDIEILPAFLGGGSVPGARATQRELFSSAGIFAALPRGSALLITGLPPGMGDAASTRGPSAGPPVSPPPTLGELLLTNGNTESSALRLHPIVVVIPLVSARHFPDSPPVESPAAPEP
ncbi:MAG: hypothetical protein EXS01_00860 [Phycisphaerales bacterium]|nr:hypothetical protein [Phycisphaerales bacterium]